MGKHGPKPFTFDQFAARFWERVNKVDDEDSCWEWQGSRLKKDGKEYYGTLSAKCISPIPMYAHRVAWELTNGPIPEGQGVLHRCDNPPCCRPSHLFLGTQTDNWDDMRRKGRQAKGDRSPARLHRETNSFVRNGGSGLKNENHPMAKLTDAQVTNLRREAENGERKVDLARKYDISVTHVWRLIKGECRPEE